MRIGWAWRAGLEGGHLLSHEIDLIYEQPVCKRNLGADRAGCWRRDACGCASCRTASAASLCCQRLLGGWQGEAGYLLNRLVFGALRLHFV